MSKSTTILGFLLSFIVGMVVIRTIDGHVPGAHATAEGLARPNAGAVKVDLHVMSQCPYGVQAENAFKDVVAKFGPDIDLHVEFIGQTAPGGDLSSMHGPNEVKGDLLQ